MNSRRTFFKKLAIGAVAFTILPSATKYARTWKPTPGRIWVPNPAFSTATYEIHWSIAMMINPLEAYMRPEFLTSELITDPFV